MSKNNSVIIFSLTVTAIIAIFLFITVFAILYFYWGDETAIKDALSTTGSFFGGFATLGTALVASYLFNDWREQHNKNVESQLCMKAFDYIQGFEFELVDIERFTILYLVNPDKNSLHEKFNNNLERLNVVADKSSVVLSDLGFFIPKKEYNEKFKPQFDIIIDQLEQYIHTYDSTFRSYISNPRDEVFIEKYRDLTADLRERYRATFVELNKYYKAL